MRNLEVGCRKDVTAAANKTSLPISHSACSGSHPKSIDRDKPVLANRFLILQWENPSKYSTQWLKERIMGPITICQHSWVCRAAKRR